MATKKKAATGKPAAKKNNAADTAANDAQETTGATIKSKDGKTVPCAKDESK